MGIDVDGKIINSGPWVDLFILEGDCGKLVQELLIKGPVKDELLWVVINFEELDAQLEPVWGLDDFGEVKLEFLDAFNLF